MSINKWLFMEDLKGANGEFARELAFREVEKYLDYDLSPEEVAEFDNLQEAYYEREEEAERLEQENAQLKRKLKLLEESNLQLRRENFSVGNLLDKMILHGRDETMRDSVVVDLSSYSN